MNNDIKVKLGVYDLEDNFLGYKSDTFWTLDTWGKQHTYMDEERLIDNLIYALNDRQESGTLLDLLLKHNEKQLNSIKDKGGCIIKSQNYGTGETLRMFRVYENNNKRVKWEYKEIK